jgi:hypothetical protein
MSELLSALDAVLAVDVHAIPEPSLLVHTETLIQARDRLDAVLSVALQAVDVRQVSVNECGRTTRSWLVEDERLAPTDAAQRVWVAKQLPFHPEIRDAFTAGDINHEHVRVILGGLRRLLPETREELAGRLLGFAREHDPGLLARYIEQVRVMTGADENAEAAAQRKYDSRWVKLSSTFDGMTAISGMLDPVSAAKLQAALAPMMVKLPDDDRTSTQRCADALAEMAEFMLRHGQLPDHGGERPQVIVTIPLSELRDGLETGQVGSATINGVPLTPEAARLAACDANLIPAVLGGRGEVLDLGRSQRHWSRAQRRARRLEDQGCGWHKCQVPLDRCQIHHLIWWEHGGPTNKDTGVHLCLFHHWLTHHTTWKIWRNTDGNIQISRTSPQVPQHTHARKTHPTATALPGHTHTPS